eukprot:COSAG02_NODE_12687_length_1509_cov_2.068794_1_plen_290_part_10
MSPFSGRMVLLGSSSFGRKGTKAAKAVAAVAAVAAAAQKRPMGRHLDEQDSMRMMMLKSVLQGKIDELVMMIKIGEDVTMTAAENQIDEIARMQPEEDLLLFLRYCERPVTPARAVQETIDSLVDKAMVCLDWAPLKEALGLGGGRSGNTGRRKSIFDDFVPQKQKEEQKGVQPLPAYVVKGIGAAYLQKCFAQGIGTVAQLVAQHEHEARRPVDVRPPVARPSGAVFGAKTGKRGRAAFRRKRRAGDEKIRDVYTTALDAELSSTSGVSLGGRLPARPPSEARPPGSRG